MKIIKKLRLQTFWHKYPAIEHKLKTWFFSVNQESWGSLEELKQTFPNAILVDKNSVFFEVLPNSYYLLTVVDFPTQSVCVQNLVRYYINPNYDTSNK